MLGEIDTFGFVLAEALGKTLGEVNALPNGEVVAWQAFFRVRRELEKLG